MTRGFHLTHESLEACYRLLLTTLPFRRWSLPHPDAVIFYAKSIDKPGTHGTQGQYWWDGISHHLQVNPHRHKTLHSALMTCGHEMVHMRIQLLRLREGAHGRQFQRLADQVCRHHGFDRGQF
jgi:hypothetical protein